MINLCPHASLLIMNNALLRSKLRRVERSLYHYTRHVQLLKYCMKIPNIVMLVICCSATPTILPCLSGYYTLKGHWSGRGELNCRCGGTFPLQEWVEGNREYFPMPILFPSCVLDMMKLPALLQPFLGHVNAFSLWRDLIFGTLRSCLRSYLHCGARQRGGNPSPWLRSWRMAQSATGEHGESLAF